MPVNTEKDEFKRFLQDQFKSNMTDTTDPFAESKAISQQYADELKSKPEQDMNMALLNTAAGMMAGDSPYFFSNVGRGAQEGVKSLAASNQQRQADKRLLLQQKVEAEKAADARKAQRSLGVERNLTDLYNREEQAATARLGYEAQLEAARIGRIPPPSEFDKNLATIEKLTALDPKGELGLVAKYKNERKDFYADRTVSDDNAITKTYNDATKTVMEALTLDPKWQELNRKNPPEARRIAKEMIIEQAQSAVDFGKNKGASKGSGSTSGKYSDMSNDQFEKLLK
jgi:signal recognition particle subunit SEC65